MKIKGVKKAVGEWQHNDCLARRVYLNVQTREVWTNVYVSLNSWTEYHDTHIVNVVSAQAYPFSTCKLTMHELTRIALTYIDAYSSGDDNWRDTAHWAITAN